MADWTGLPALRALQVWTNEMSRSGQRALTAHCAIRVQADGLSYLGWMALLGLPAGHVALVLVGTVRCEANSTAGTARVPCLCVLVDGRPIQGEWQGQDWPAHHFVWVLVERRSDLGQIALLAHRAAWVRVDGWSSSRRSGPLTLRAFRVRADKLSYSGWMARPRLARSLCRAGSGRWTV